MASATSRTVPGRILIVDDNSMGSLARRSVLEELGHEVFTSPAPHDALELCGKHEFDIVITDYKMPKMNGVEFISRLRKLHAGTSVILLSGFTDTLGLTEASTGADIVLQKSANEVNHLIRAVSRLQRKSPPKKKPAASQAAGRTEKRKGI